MIYYLILVVLFIVIIVFYSILVSKSRNLADTSEKINNSMGEYFVLLSNFEKIIKEENNEIKKDKIYKLLNEARLYCSKYPSSAYKKDIEKLILKLNELEKNYAIKETYPTNEADGNI